MFQTIIMVLKVISDNVKGDQYNYSWSLSWSTDTDTEGATKEHEPPWKLWYIYITH